MKFNRSYVCEPNNISITAENTPTHSKGIKLIFYFDNKEVLPQHKTFQRLPPIMMTLMMLYALTVI